MTRNDEWAGVNHRLTPPVRVRRRAGRPGWKHAAAEEWPVRPRVAWRSDRLPPAGTPDRLHKRHPLPTDGAHRFEVLPLEPGGARVGATARRTVISSWRTLPGQVCTAIAAWAAARAKQSYLRAQLLRLKSRNGPKKAVLAVAASMLTATCYMLRDGVEYP